MGAKLIGVCGLAVLMTLPAIYIASLVDERTERASQVIREISASSGGPQTFLGPTLAIPYKSASPTNSAYFVFPAQASATVKTAIEERHRSLFKVPVFQADVNFNATFDLTGAANNSPKGVELDWDRAEIVVGASDPRGAVADAILTAQETTTAMVPSEVAPDLVLGGPDTGQTKLVLFGARLPQSPKPDAQFSVSSALRFSGAQRIAVLAFGKSTRVAAQGDWPNPSFDGGFLPVHRTVSPNGYTAEWSVPFIARGVHAEGPEGSLRGLQATALGTSFVELADPYQSVNRSVKYVILFVGLVFLSYFGFEASTGKRLHPAQYVLVGLAQAIFYLLLLSLAERAGFDWGFLAAGVSTVTLLSCNVVWVFGSKLQAVRAAVLFSLLYGLIYFLLRMEDYALLTGAVASFLAIAAVMYLTRRIDWYGTMASPPVDHRGPA